jgi:hypothetical protein
MITYYESLDAMHEARGKHTVSMLIGTNDIFGTLSKPRIIFIDEIRGVFTEQWSIEGRYRGWIEEIVPKKEYFKRKLVGK